MKSAKQHYEEWKHVLPNFTEEQKRKLYFMMNDYARDYHDSEVKKLNIPDVVGLSEQLFCRDCKYDNAETYHDKMWCRDCRQKDRFTAK